VNNRTRNKIFKRAIRKIKTGQPLSKLESEVLLHVTGKAARWIVRYLPTALTHISEYLPAKIQEWKQTTGQQERS